ncbi:cellulose synthase operon C protein [Pandoraea thiooxydans]|uniref:YaeQ family protein n=1 Tax=Pandoraea thiooxydans TaxID=445709 RepID=A0A0G3EX09_9BURK|nr:YaeQ family protein [Pandoraea thiooxydans]AKJ69321.1 hypothetical protein ABW99_14940 [Pandoraea thiooxydans]APR96937.1 cellulose synthase operon C protein [Pandoraea thiooxydans]MDE2609140.1 YaeQ family protein [Burkholderiales bacterium]
MALKATIYKADVQIADLDRQYYQDHALTIARHPSETDERMMVRLLAFLLHAHEHLSFGKGLSTADEPDLWQHDLTGAIACWIDVGLPDERRLSKACGRAERVYVYAYGGRAASVWWEQNAGKLARTERLTVRLLSDDDLATLGGLAQRNMRLQCTIQDGSVWLSDGQQSVPVTPETLLAPRADH